jgi:hypothetical protein
VPQGDITIYSISSSARPSNVAAWNFERGMAAEWDQNIQYPASRDDNTMKAECPI